MEDNQAWAAVHFDGSWRLVDVNGAFTGVTAPLVPAGCVLIEDSGEAKSCTRCTPAWSRPAINVVAWGPAQKRKMASRRLSPLASGGLRDDAAWREETHLATPLPAGLPSSSAADRRSLLQDDPGSQSLDRRRLPREDYSAPCLSFTYSDPHYT